MEYILAAVKVCSNPCVGPIPKINMSFFLLSVCVEKLIPSSKINASSPYPPPGN